MPILNEINNDSIILESIYEKYPDETFLTLDGFNEAILGVEDNQMKIVYSTKKIISSLITNDEMTYEDAIEFFDYNIKGAYVGEKTPIFVDDIF